MQIQNFSSLTRTNVIVPFNLPSDAKEGSYQIAEGSVGENILPLFSKASEKTKLYTQLSIKPNEEKTVLLTQVSNPTNQLLTPTTDPGTDYLFVNYKTAIIVSTEAQNPISFFSADGKMLNSDQKPLLLGKGKWFVLESSTPKLTRVLSEKPIYIFCSSLKEFTDVDSVEPGDSDTTTLYGEDLYFFTEKHLFMAAYKKTQVKILDSNDIEVWSGTIEADKGIFQENLKRGAYHLVADQPLTIQFGYLDDENFSLLYGGPGKINAYAFGDLMISSLYPNTKVTLQYGNEKLTKKEFTFKQTGTTQIVSLIEQFLPKNPEYIFVSLTFNNPILASTFSSGNNFGGEYLPGINGMATDTDFSFVTLRVSPEFSKEQKNLIELIGLTNNTNITASGAWKKSVVLQEKSNYIFTSSTPMEKIVLTSDKPFQVSQIHNNYSKGLFYWIPPTKDTSLQVFISDQTGEAMIQNSSTLHQNMKFLFNKSRFRDFFIVLKTPSFLAITIFFSSLLLLILFSLFWIWLSFAKSKGIKNSDPEALILPEKEIEEIKNHLFDEMISKPISLEEITPKVEKEQPLPPSLPTKVVFPNRDYVDLPPPKEKTIPTKAEESSEPKLVPQASNQCTPSSTSFLATLRETKIVLDPGSANRLYIEGQLSEIHYPYMVKSSSKKITSEVTEKMNKIDLSLQDIAKANVYKDSLSTFEEAGKALALCKKLKISYYISSYKLPSLIQGVHVIHISDALKPS